jgi:hypothetical protein
MATAVEKGAEDQVNFAFVGGSLLVGLLTYKLVF